ncbi:MAG TPA: hypothetical protein DCQ83_08120 [Fibrobacteres bacterium]|jgi:hypothetical protein|nr:hypothetical protein [Fibrobacterota bacterium]
MRLGLMVVLSGVCLFSRIANAEDLNLSEKPETTSVYLTPYAIGPGIGAQFALNQELKDQSQAFLKFSLSQSWRFKEHWDFGLDLDWSVPGTNVGGLLNLNYVFGENGFRPFVGLGAGIGYVDDPLYTKFGQRLGIAGMGYAGMYIDVTDNAHLRLRVPVEVVGNSKMDRSVGLDIAVLFSLPPYSTKVKKLKY